MAEYYDVNDPEVEKKWSKDIWIEFRKNDAICDPKNGLVGKRWQQHMIVEQDELEKAPGDRVRSTFLEQLQGEGVISDGVLEGQEETIDTSTHDLFVDELIHGVRTRSRMYRQRVSFDGLEKGKALLGDWWKRRRAVTYMNHLCSYTVQTNKAYTGLNTVQAADDEHIYRVGQGLGQSDDQTVGADNTAVLDVDVIDELASIAPMLDPAMPPVEINGNPYYLLFLHPWQVNKLRETSTSWWDTMVAALQGGAIKDNPIFTRALGMWSNVILMQEPRVTRGIDTSGASDVPDDDSRRAVLCGAGALQVAYGRYQKGNKDKMQWFNGTHDHGRKFHASAGMIFGVNSPRFTFSGTVRHVGKVVVTSHAPPPTGKASVDTDQTVPS